MNGLERVVRLLIAPKRNYVIELPFYLRPAKLFEKDYLLYLSVISLFAANEHGEEFIF